MMTKSVCRWGILGTANIARKNWRAIRMAENATLTAVASRTTERAQTFINECQATDYFANPLAAVGSYDALLTRDDVDAIYIPLPTGLRKEWVLKAAQAGKHVLVEKPVGVAGTDVREMLDACMSANVQFMDGVMFMHSQRLEALRTTLEDGESVGTLRRIATQFSFQAGEEFLKGDIRMHGNLEPAGCVGDLGWYNIRFTLWAMKYQMPTRVRGQLLAAAGSPDSPDRVPVEFSGELLFGNDVSASFYCSFQTENQQWANLSGSKGFIHVRDFVLPFYGSEADFTVSRAGFCQVGCDFDALDHTNRIAISEFSNGRQNSQETNMIRQFSKLALSGKPDQTWGEITLKTQTVMDACLTSAQQDGAWQTITA